MINVLLTGVGGQGTVLAAKILAQAAQDKGWLVRTAETIGMAQRGGNVVSHVRMGNEGEPVHAPLVAAGSADLVVAFEPAEAARALPYLKPEGTLVSATTPIQPVTAALAGGDYRAQDVIEALSSSVVRFRAVDDAALVRASGSRRTLNVMLLACALKEADLGISLDDLRAAVAACVKPKFVEMNLRAIDVATGAADAADGE